MLATVLLIILILLLIGALPRWGTAPDGGIILAAGSGLCS
jgi:Protein of unknown function (DUF3309)